jgi:hypothetical protein
LKLLVLPHGPGFDAKTTAIFLTTSVHAGPLIIIFTNNVKSSLDLRRLRGNYEVPAGMGLNSEKKKKIKRGLNQLTVISHLFNTPKSLNAQLL